MRATGAWFIARPFCRQGYLLKSKRPYIYISFLRRFLLKAETCMNKIDENHKCKSDAGITSPKTPGEKGPDVKKVNVTCDSLGEIENFSEMEMPENFSEMEMPENFPEMEMPENFSEMEMPENFSEMEMPENFSEMERKIFLAHKNAIEVIMRKVSILCCI